MLSVKQGGIKYHFRVFGMTRPRIEPKSPGPLANTITAKRNPAKKLHYSEIFIWAVELKCPNLESKKMSSSIFNWIIYFGVNVIFINQIISGLNEFLWTIFSI